MAAQSGVRSDNMANSNKGPWGKVFALVPADKDTTDFLDIGVAWMNQDKDGNDYLSIELKVWPVAWGSPSMPRKLQIQKMKERREGNRR
jgi:uncharacterized protein (DUF736 family)